MDRVGVLLLGRPRRVSTFRTTAHELSCKGTRNRSGMRHQDGNPPKHALRFIENAELSENGASVIVDSFPGQTVLRVECVHTAERKLNSSPGRRKTSPAAEVCTPNHDLNKNGIICDMLALHRDFQVGQRVHELFVKLPYSIPAPIVFSPRLVVIMCGITERTKNSFKIMLIFQPDVLLNNCDASRPLIVGNRFAGHIHLHRHRPVATTVTDTSTALFLKISVL